jgi:hypothetical protein
MATQNQIELFNNLCEQLGESPMTEEEFSRKPSDKAYGIISDLLEEVKIMKEIGGDDE